MVTLDKVDAPDGRSSEDDMADTTIDAATKASEQLIQAGEIQETLTDLLDAFIAQHDEMARLVDKEVQRCECDLCTLARETLAVIEEG
jgi:hypothetical protein